MPNPMGRHGWTGLQGMARVCANNINAHVDAVLKPFQTYTSKSARKAKTLKRMFVSPGDAGYSSCTATERKSSRPPATAVPVLMLVTRTRIQPPAGDARSSTKVVLVPQNKSSRPPATAVPVLKLYCRRTKIQPPAGDARSSTKVVSCNHRPKIQPAAGDGRSSTKVVLPKNENPAGLRRRPFQY